MCIVYQIMFSQYHTLCTKKLCDLFSVYLKGRNGGKEINASLFDGTWKMSTHSLGKMAISESLDALK